MKIGKLEKLLLSLSDKKEYVMCVNKNFETSSKIWMISIDKNQ